MAGLRGTIARLNALKRRFQEHLGAAGHSPAKPFPRKLMEVTGFGANPGQLRMFVYRPKHVQPRPALVVALHGCTQTAETYNHGCGWADLADRAGFVVVFPQQQSENNPKNCFSWFQPSDTGRDHGEARSIRQIIERAATDFNVDRSRIFISGLSAGGAMTAAMLASYPELFAGGAIIAGLPYGCAKSVQQAFEAMFNATPLTSKILGDHVRSASKHHGPWPKISVWHGTADHIVKPVNAENLVRQWTDVHGLSAQPSHVEAKPGYSRRAWSDANGTTVLEAILVPGMGHGVPLSSVGTDVCGATGPFFLDVGISSTHSIARFWGILEATSDQAAKSLDARPVTMNVPQIAVAADATLVPNAGHDNDVNRPHDLDLQGIIAKAFRAAGLPEPEFDVGASGGPSKVAPGPVITAALKAAGLISK